MQCPLSQIMREMTFNRKKQLRFSRISQFPIVTFKSNSHFKYYTYIGLANKVLYTAVSITMDRKIFIKFKLCSQAQAEQKKILSINFSDLSIQHVELKKTLDS